MASFFAGVLLPRDKADLVDSWRKKFYPEVVSRHPPHITVAKLESPDLEVAKEEIEQAGRYFDFVAIKKVLFKERSDGSWEEFLSVS